MAFTFYIANSGLTNNNTTTCTDARFAGACRAMATEKEIAPSIALDACSSANTVHAEAARPTANFVFLGGLALFLADVLFALAVL